MKLTNTIRDAFVRAVLNDVPEIDYSEEKSRILQAEARERLPAKVRAIFDDKELRGFLGTKYVKGCYVYAATDYEPTAGTLKKIEAINKKNDAQRTRNQELRSKLYAVARSVTTRDALAKALPEFVKYLPASEAAASRMVPVVANVVADFVKAGWPKDKKPQPEKIAAPAP